MNTYQTRARSEDLTRCLKGFRSSITIREHRIAARLLKEAQTEMLLSECSSFMEDLPPFQEDKLTSTYSVIGLETPRLSLRYIKAFEGTHFHKSGI